MEEASDESTRTIATYCIIEICVHILDETINENKALIKSTFEELMTFGTGERDAIMADSKDPPVGPVGSRPKRCRPASACASSAAQRR